ncbi:MAG TPA: AAA family ATPase, partial [Vicinamibacterales bacterium]|nr:AAA family ATPase [Vicinamibacterales bacterium]
MEKFPVLNSVTRSLNASSALLTYEPYYGLREKPFSLSTDPKFLYKSAAHAGTFEDLLLAIRRREGLIVLTGDIGTGKTTLCKAVLERLDRKTFTTFVPDPFVTREDLLKMLLLDFGVMSVDDLKSGRMSGASRPELSYPLYEFLKSLVPLQAFAVLIIDEAQNLSSELLEEIRILSDLESPDKMLQVVLVGQLELQAKLKLPEMRQLDQRVSARCSLNPLSREGVAGYISHRLGVAGGADDRVHFSPNAGDAVFRASGGIPRVVNLICDRALHRGHLARKSVIDLEAVTQAIDDLGVGSLTAPSAALVAPIAPVAPVAPVVNTDLSGLEVQDIQDIEESVEAPPMFGTAAYSRHSIFGQNRPRRRWRSRVLRWVGALALAFAIVFFALLGEAVFLNYFAVSPEELPRPAASTPLRMA